MVVHLTAVVFCSDGGTFDCSCVLVSSPWRWLNCWPTDVGEQVVNKNTSYSYSALVGCLHITDHFHKFICARDKINISVVIDQKAEINFSERELHSSETGCSLWLFEVLCCVVLCSLLFGPFNLSTLRTNNKRKYT